MNLSELYELKPCKEALVWLEQQPDLHTAWEQCIRADWMLWFLYKREKIHAISIKAYKQAVQDIDKRTDLTLQAKLKLYADWIRANHPNPL